MEIITTYENTTRAIYNLKKLGYEKVRLSGYKINGNLQFTDDDIPLWIVYTE